MSNVNITCWEMHTSGKLGEREKEMTHNQIKHNKPKPQKLPWISHV